MRYLSFDKIQTLWSVTTWQIWTRHVWQRWTFMSRVMFIQIENKHSFTCTNMRLYNLLFVLVTSPGSLRGIGEHIDHFGHFYLILYSDEWRPAADDFNYLIICLCLMAGQSVITLGTSILRLRLHQIHWVEAPVSTAFDKTADTREVRTKSFSSS